MTICDDCGGRCCSFRKMDISYLGFGEQSLESFLEETDLSNLLMDDGSVPDMEWYVRDDRFLVFHCNHLEDGRCTVYENRPEMCQSYECELLTGEMEFTEFMDVSAPVDDPELVEVTEQVTEAIKND